MTSEEEEQNSRLIIKLLREDPRGYVQLCQLKDLFRRKYGMDLKQRRLKKTLASLPGIWIDDSPVKEAVHAVGARKYSHHSALIQTLNSRGGKIKLKGLKSAYKTITNNIPPYPTKDTRRWILSVKRIQITNDMVQLVSATNQEIGVHPPASTNKVRGRKKTTQITNNMAGIVSVTNRQNELHLPVSIKKVRGRTKTRRNDTSRNHPKKACTKEVPVMKKNSHPETSKGKKISIMHFGLTVHGKSLCPESTQIKPKYKHNRHNKKSPKIPYSVAIMSGYLSNKRKKAGGTKAARKAENLARLRKRHNPPAISTDHALQRYREQGSSSSPIYQRVEDGKAIIVTYIPIKRESYYQAKRSKLEILSEINRMNYSANISGLPRSKLSSRDAYLLKLSNRVVERKESERRLTQREKAYKKNGCGFNPQAQNFWLTPRKAKSNLTRNFGTRRYPSCWAPQNTTTNAQKKRGPSKRNKSKKKRSYLEKKKMRERSYV